MWKLGRRIITNSKNVLQAKQAGDIAEETAFRFLVRKGLRLIAKNYRCYQGEIDLIMHDIKVNELVFVEVRFRKNCEYGDAVESIDEKKIKRIIKATHHFLQSKDWLFSVHSRFDVIAIHPMKGKMQIEWIKYAFSEDEYE
ncbi:MAG: YraN family protein [Gammaproteobacteria bacterium]|nr:YraN family protein [Gammaproteobacteria bacterium]